MSEKQPGADSKPGAINRREFLRTAGLATGAALSGLLPASMLSAAEAATRPASQPDGRPNILFFFPDQHRCDWLGVNPAMPVRTPNLDGLARRGLRFAQAICPSPLCAPSRAALACGKEYDRCRVPSNSVNYPLDQRTFYTLLRDSGYHVSGCGKFDLHKATSNWGLDGKHLLNEWGFSDGIDSAGKFDAVRSGRDKPVDPYMAFLESKGLRKVHIEDMDRRKSHAAAFPTPLPDDAYGDNWVAGNGLELLDRAPKGKPWFIQIHFPGPHDPWDITKKMEESCRQLKGFPPVNGDDGFSDAENLAVRQNYSAMVENIDRWLGVYIKRLADRDELANTLVVYSSDHGEMLGDHNAWGKQKPWQPSAGVPLILAGPDVRPGQVHDGPAATLDLAATFLDYAGVNRPADMDSRSLRPLLNGMDHAGRGHVLSGLGQWRLVFDGRFKLVRGFESGGAAGKDAVMLYDLKNDPGERKNLAADSPDEVARLSKLLPPAQG